MTGENFNIDRVLRWRLILEEYSPDTEYIHGAKIISTYALSQLPNNGNQEITHESTYATETMSEIYDIKEIPQGTFSLYFISVEYIKGYLCGGQNTINILSFNDKIVIPQLLKRCVVK